MTAGRDYRGAELGLPERGQHAMAGSGRRLLALCVDWALCWVIAYGAFGVALGTTGARSFVPLAILAVENLLLVSTTGTTVGHRLLGLQVHRLNRTGSGPALLGPPGFARGVVRAVLLCLAVPAMVWDADGRGFHDKAAGTVIVRSR